MGRAPGASLPRALGVLHSTLATGVHGGLGEGVMGGTGQSLSTRPRTCRVNRACQSESPGVTLGTGALLWHARGQPPAGPQKAPWCRDAARRPEGVASMCGGAVRGLVGHLSSQPARSGWGWGPASRRGCQSPWHRRVSLHAVLNYLHSVMLSDVDIHGREVFQLQGGVGPADPYPPGPRVPALPSRLGSAHPSLQGTLGFICPARSRSLFSLKILWSQR